MWSPGAPCEAGVMIFCGTENQQKTNFPDTPTWVLVSDTFPLCEDSHINAISLPHLKRQKKKKNVHPASWSQHSVTTVPCSAVRAAPSHGPT